MSVVHSLQSSSMLLPRSWVTVTCFKTMYHKIACLYVVTDLDCSCPACSHTATQQWGSNCLTHVSAIGSQLRREMLCCLLVLPNPGNQCELRSLSELHARAIILEALNTLSRYHNATFQLSLFAYSNLQQNKHFSIDLC